MRDSIPVEEIKQVFIRERRRLYEKELGAVKRKDWFLANYVRMERDQIYMIAHYLGIDCWDEEVDEKGQKRIENLLGEQWEE